MFKNYIKGTIIFFVSIFIFSFLEFESSIIKIDTFIQPLIFAATLSISLCLPQLKKIVLAVSLLLLAVMILIYLFNMIEIANWIGSLGFGMLFVILSTYLPELLKRGYIEKF